MSGETKKGNNADKTTVVVGGARRSLKSRIVMIILSVCVVGAVAAGLYYFFHWRPHFVTRKAGEAAELSSKGDTTGAKRAIDQAIGRSGSGSEKAKLYLQKGAACEEAKDDQCVFQSYQQAADLSGDDSTIVTAYISWSAYARSRDNKEEAVKVLTMLRDKLAAQPEKSITVPGQEAITVEQIDSEIKQLKK